MSQFKIIQEDKTEKVFYFCEKMNELTVKVHFQQYSNHSNEALQEEMNNLNIIDV